MVNENCAQVSAANGLGDEVAVVLEVERKERMP